MKNELALTLVDLLPFFSAVYYLLLCPYTKVEESFNIQGLFDFSNYLLNIDNYDHLQFAGVVPRSFIGVCAISSIGMPFQQLLIHLRYGGLVQQILFRLVYIVITCSIMIYFRRAISQKFSNRTAQLFMIIFAAQFHLNFYMSRTLPNTYALMFSMLAHSLWLRAQPLKALIVLAFTAIIFRCDLLVLIVPLTLQMLIAGEIPFFSSLLVGIITAVFSIGLTVAVDSYFWQRWLWPEGVVLFFNTVENKSSEWGVMPFHWYFSNALLKSLNLSLFWLITLICGVSVNQLGKLQAPLRYTQEQKKCIYYLSPSFLYVCLYSFLPHKELRFLFPVLPIFTLGSAVGLNHMLNEKSDELLFPLNLLHNDIDTQKAKKDDDLETVKSPRYDKWTSLFTSFLAIGTVVGMFLLSQLFLMASIHNYPGGHALDRLLTQHIPLYISELYDVDSLQAKEIRPLFVHIDVPAAMSGVTRFGQERIMKSSLFSSIISNDDCKHKNAYLNLDPTQYYACESGDTSASWCKNICSDDLLFYSKNESKDIDHSQFDWLITVDSNKHLSTGHFVLMERINSFQRITFDKYGPKVVLSPSLAILKRLHHEDE